MVKICRGRHQEPSLILNRKLGSTWRTAVRASPALRGPELNAVLPLALLCDLKAGEQRGPAGLQRIFPWCSNQSSFGSMIVRAMQLIMALDAVSLFRRFRQTGSRTAEARALRISTVYLARVTFDGGEGGDTDAESLGHHRNCIHVKRGSGCGAGGKQFQDHPGHDNRAILLCDLRKRPNGLCTEMQRLGGLHSKLRQRLSDMRRACLPTIISEC